MTASASRLSASRGEALGVPILVQMHGTKCRLRQIAIAAIPLDIFFNEVDAMAAAGERVQQRSIGGGVAVAPGRGDGEAVDDELHTCAAACSSAAFARGEAMAEGCFGLKGALRVGMVAESALMEGRSDVAASCGVVGCERVDDILGGAHHENFAAGLEAVVDAGPVVAEQAGARAGDFKNAGGR